MCLLDATNPQGCVKIYLLKAISAGPCNVIFLNAVTLRTPCNQLRNGSIRTGKLGGHGYYGYLLNRYLHTGAENSRAGRRDSAPIANSVLPEGAISHPSTRVGEGRGCHVGNYSIGGERGKGHP